MTAEQRPSAKRPAVAPTEAGPTPWGGWGLFIGGFAAWMGVVLMSHLNDLGIKDPFRVLGSFYDLNRYRGIESAGALVALVIRHLWHITAVLVIVMGALGWGLVSLRLPRLRQITPALRSLLALGIGFAFLGLLMLAGGLAGLWYPAYPAVLVFAGVIQLRGRRAAVEALVPPAPGAWDIWPLAGLAMGTAALWVAVALTPEVFYDSQVYHLADPANWAKQHKVFALPYNFFSNFPFTFEMLFAIGVMWGHDAIAKLVHVAISLTAAGLIGWMAAWLATEAGRRIRPAHGVPEARSSAGLVSGPERGGPGIPDPSSRSQGRSAGWIAALIYLTTPLIGSMAWLTGIDAGLVLYETATVLCFIFWWQSVRPIPSMRSLTSVPYFRPAASSPWLLLAAVFSGLGMGVKYTLGMTTGLLGLGLAFRLAAPDERAAMRAWVVAILVVLTPFTLSNVKEVREAAVTASLGRPLVALWFLAALTVMIATMRAWGFRRSAVAVMVAVAFGAIAWLFVAPWNLKAWVFTRNPVFPFAYGSFNSFHVSPPRMDYQMGEFREFRYRPFLEWLVHPWYITKIAGFSNNSACGGLFLAALPALLLFRGVPVAVRLLGITLLGRYLLWSNVSNIVRYFAPGLALLGVLTGVMVGGWCARRVLARTIGVVAVTAFSLVNLFGLLIVAQSSVSFLGVVCGLESERDSLMRERPSYPCTPYAACEAMNRQLAGRPGVLYVGEARGMFYRGRVVAATVFDLPPLTEICHAARAPEDVTRKLRQLGLTHVLYNGVEGQRISGYHIVEWLTPRDRDVFERWWAGSLRLIWESGWLAAYEVVPGSVKERTAPLSFLQFGHEEFQVLMDLDQRASHAMQQAQFADAVAAGTELVRRAPQAARAHEVLGQALAYQGKAERAIAEFKRAVALGLVTSQVHDNLAVMFRRLGRTQDATREFGIAREIDAKYTGGGG